MGHRDLMAETVEELKLRIDDYEEEIKVLEGEIAMRRKRIAHLHREIGLLLAQLPEAG